jgi:hypothetical protein
MDREAKPRAEVEYVEAHGRAPVPDEELSLSPKPVLPGKTGLSFTMMA